MDHKQAEDLAVKYVLGELPPVQRDEYEDHYIDCPDCAKDVYAAAAFTDTAREVLRQEARGEAPAPARERAQSRWFAWLRPAVAVPVFAVLLIVVAYQNTVTIPRAKQEAARGAGEMFTSTFSFPKTDTRGGVRRGGDETKGGEEASQKEELRVQVRPDESFGLEFDFVPAKTFSSYLCELRDDSGRTLVRKVVPETSANREAEFAVDGGLVKPGKYNLVFTGVPGSNSEASREEVLRLGFSVEFRQ